MRLIQLEPANIVCPKCGNGNYMRHLVGKNVGRLDIKCINCNSYFNFDELCKVSTSKLVDPITHYDLITSKTPQELSEYITVHTRICPPTRPGCRTIPVNLLRPCQECWLEWLNSAVEDNT